jgi:hypothetical protein
MKNNFLSAEYALEGREALVRVGEGERGIGKFRDKSPPPNTLPTKAAPPSSSVGASARTHSTLLTLSSSLRVKGLTRGCYSWWTKANKLAPPLLY